MIEEVQDSDNDSTGTKDVAGDESNNLSQKNDTQNKKSDNDAMPESVLAEARKMGWKPEDEYDGEPGKWIPAEEYVARAPIFEKNRKLTRKIKDLESSVSALKQHYERVEELAYNRAVSDLKAQKIKALEEGDHAAVVDIDDKIIELKKPKAPQVTSNPDFDVWVERNPWYEVDEELKEYADFVGSRYASQNPGALPEQVYRHAESTVRARFPEKFRNPNKSRPAAVEGVSRSSSKSSKPSWNDLPDHFQQVGNKFVRQGVMTRDQYIDDLIKLGEIKGK